MYGNPHGNIRQKHEREDSKKKTLSCVFQEILPEGVHCKRSFREQEYIGCRAELKIKVDKATDGLFAIETMTAGLSTFATDRKDSDTSEAQSRQRPNQASKQHQLHCSSRRWQNGTVLNVRSFQSKISTALTCAGSQIAQGRGGRGDSGVDDHKQLPPFLPMRLPGLCGT
jgi:hypothetical protein